jgi:hypothetical protein
LKPELQENKWRNMPPEAPASGGFLFAENKFQFIELFIDSVGRGLLPPGILWMPLPEGQ